MITDYKIFLEVSEAHGDKIVFEDFINIIRTSGLLVEKALRGQLVLPDFINFSNKIDKIFKEVKNITSGDLASLYHTISRSRS